MKVIIDAQLPRKLAAQLRESGYDALHTLDLSLSKRTPDSVISALSLNNIRRIAEGFETFDFFEINQSGIVFPR